VYSRVILVRRDEFLQVEKGGKKGGGERLVGEKREGGEKKILLDYIQGNIAQTAVISFLIISHSSFNLRYSVNVSFGQNSGKKGGRYQRGEKKGEKE